MKEVQILSLSLTALCLKNPGAYKISSDQRGTLRCQPSASKKTKMSFGQQQRLSEETSDMDDATVWTHGNMNHERMAEMTIPAQVVSNKSVVGPQPLSF